MERTHRFAVTVLGALTLSTVLGVPQHPRAAVPMPLNGQTAVAVTWHFDSLPIGQPPAGFSFGRTGGGRVGRSEERRVGKEWRARGWRGGAKKKEERRRTRLRHARG